MHTFFETACREGQLADVRFFLSKGFSVDARNAQGLSALMLAADTGQMGLSLLLLRFGASVDVTNATGQTASMIAQSRGHMMLAKLLCGKSERRQRDPIKPKRSCLRVNQVALVRLLEYGTQRGFLSDAQIYSYLPALRRQPTGFSVVCQALQSLGIVLRDRTPDLQRHAQSVRLCTDATMIDLNAYADSLMNNLRAEPNRQQPAPHTYSLAAAQRPLIGCAANLTLEGGVKHADGQAVRVGTSGVVSAAVRCGAG